MSNGTKKNAAKPVVKDRRSGHWFAIIEGAPVPKKIDEIEMAKACGFEVVNLAEVAHRYNMEEWFAWQLWESVVNPEAIVRIPDRTSKHGKAWDAMADAYWNHPLIHDRLRKLEKIAGGSDVNLWLAAALFDFTEWDDEGSRQQSVIQMLCNQAGQECKVER